MAATTISRSNIGTNDDGSGTTGTVINTAYIALAVYDAIDALFSATGGITLNQAGGDSAILTFESSDVAHGITTVAATSAYAQLGKQTDIYGGLMIRGLTENIYGLDLQGYYTNDENTKSNAGQGAIRLLAQKRSGTGVTDPAANANVIVVQAGSLVRFILDADGDSHQDVSTAWTNFDAHDDIALLDALTGLVSQPVDPLRSHFAALVDEHRDALVRNRIVTVNDHDGGDGSIFVNWSRFHMLMIGAVRQLGRDLADTRGRLLAIEGRA
jgi:hypothetical protein